MRRSGRGKKLGAALITALFIVMVTFFLATVIYANAQRQLRLTQGSALETQRHYAALGAVNEAIARLSEGERWEDHPQDSPLTFSTQDISAEAWYSEDPDNPDLLHVTARVHHQGRPGQSLWRTRVVRKGGGSDGSVYSLQFADAGIPSIMTRPISGGDWELLPNPEDRIVLTLGATQNGLYSINADIPFLAFALFRAAVGGGSSLNGANYQLIFGGALVEHPAVRPLHSAGISDWTLSRYDTNTESWTDVFTFPRGEIGGSPSPTENGVYIPVVSRTEGGKVYYFDNQTGAQSEIPPPPRDVYGADGTVSPGSVGGVLQVARNSSTDPLFANSYYEAGNAISRLNPDGTWELLPPVPGDYLDENLVTQPGPRVADTVMLAGVTPDNEPVVTTMATMSDLGDLANLDRGRPDNILVFREGRWETITPPRSGNLDGEGNFVEGTAYERSFHSVSVDADGRIVTSSFREGIDVNRVFENGSWSVLPPAPKHYNTRSGPRQEDGFHSELMDLSAGTLSDPDGQNRYVPLSTY